jgi:arylsulfatase A-like enzyme
MKVSVSQLLPFVLALPLSALAHTPGAALGQKGKTAYTEELRQHILDEYMQSAANMKPQAKAAVPLPEKLRRPVMLASTAAAPSSFYAMLMASIAPLASAPSGNGALMAASFAPFKPKVRYYWDATTFYEESDNMPDNMPNRMVGITSWQQQVPIPAAYFASVTNPEGTTSSLGYGQPNYWRLPLVPTVAASPTLIFTPGSTNNNFQRGAVALASNGVAIFNPANNTGRVSYEIGELDYYGGHCGQADDYHYHIVPMHLSARFGGPLSDDKPVAWALDGYPIYGYVEPDGSARLALDSVGGHDHGNGWGYHYHAVGTNTVDATHPYGTPQTPYMMTSFKGTVVNFGGQVDGQPEITPIRQSGTGGYTAQPVNGALFNANAYKNPVALTTDGSGNLIEDTSPGAVASADNYRLRVTISGTDYDECWKINRNANPKTLTITWRLPGATTTTTYTPSVTSNAGARLTTYPLAGWSETKLPDTGQTLTVPGAPFGEDADYTINPPSLTDNGDGTITDNVTGLMWQKTDAGEMTWANAVSRSSLQLTAGYTDWRLPTPAELFSILNHNNNPSFDQTKFPNTNSADYWWTSDIYGTDATHVWCTNAGGGLGPKPITETISAGGSLRYNARYVRGGKPNNGHNYINNNDGTITDADTSLMWTQLPAAAMTWQSALSYAESLSSGGYTDWRLPTVKELQTLTDYTLATASGTTGIKPSINRTLFAKTLTNCTTTAGGTTITCDDTTGLIAGMVLVDTVDAGNTYLPGATPPVIASVTNSTSFTVTSGSGVLAGTGRTYKALVPPTAYWTSTVQKAGTPTAAWLVEMGVNNSVPAQNGPARGAQGIISYEVFSSSYPVFAVRTTSITTQIAVAQGASTLTDGVSTVGFSGMGTKTFTITNTGGTSLTLNGVTLDGANASNFMLVGAPASPTTLAAGASTSFGVIFSGASAGASYGAALHIASSDTAVGAAFDVTLTGTVPVIGTPTTNPTSIENTDTPYVTTAITPPSGVTISQVQLSYSQGAQTSSPVFYETMTALPYSQPWQGNAALNAWTTTSGGGGQISQASNGSNHSTPVTLTACTTTSGSPTVTCASTVGVWPGMLITGTNVPAGTTVSSITNATTLVMNANATGSGTAQTLYAGGLTLSGCSITSGSTTVTCPSTAGLVGAVSLSLTSGATTNGSATVTCASTTGLQVGMVVTGTGVPANTVVKAVLSATQFTLSANATATNSALTLTATLSGMAITGTGIPNNTTVASVTNSTQFTLSGNAAATNASATLTVAGCGLQLTRGSSLYTDNMVTTTNAIPAAGLAGTLQFYVQTQNFAAGNGWTTQLSPDGGTTWNTRLSESYASTSVPLTGCSLTSGSSTITCASTSGLTAGMSVASPSLVLSSCSTTNASPTVTCASTTGLTAGMVIVGTGIPNNSTVSSITDTTHFVLSANATATNSGQTFTAISGIMLTSVSTTSGSTTVTCASTTGLVAGMSLTGANSVPATAYVSSITNGTTFVLSTAATATTTGQGLVGTYLAANSTIGSITDATHFVVSTAPNLTTSGIALVGTTANHGYQSYSYTLQQSELVNTLKMRFQFSGYNPPAPTRSPIFNVDDISLSTTPGVTLTMFDDGAHGDGAAGDGVYGVQLPAFASGTLISYSIKVTDSSSTVTTLSNAGGYTVTQPLDITTASALPGALTSAAYTQSLVATGGSGSGYSWNVTSGALPPGITLGTNGAFSGTPTTAGTYSFTATVTDSAAHTVSQAFTLISSTPPNVLLIVTDDQGWGDIGYHTYAGRIRVDTPAMDSFATKGIRLERFYPTAVCSVTRSTLLTGRSAIRTGVNNSRGLDLSEHIMPQTFAAAGYQTFMAGKWHCGGADKNIAYATVNGQSTLIIQEGIAYAPTNRGWGLHYGTYSGAVDCLTHRSAESLIDNVYKPDWWLNNVIVDGASEHTDSQGHGGYSGDLLADKIIAQIQTRDTSKPFLGYLAFNTIHGPVSAPSDVLAKYANASDPTHYIADVPTRTLAASVDNMDKNMARVLSALDTAGITNNTIVVFFSDNGGENATGGSDLPLRGAKTDPYEGGIRTPAGIRWPGQLAGGLAVTHCVTTAGTTVTCDSTTGLAAGMALSGTGLAYGTTVASVTDSTHFVLSAAPTTPSSPSSITLTAGVISNLYLWVGDLFPTLCAATGVTPQNTKPFDGLNMWPALKSISGANPNGTQTRFETNPDGSQNLTTPNVSPLVTVASPNVGFNNFTDPLSGQTKTFKLIYSPTGGGRGATATATVSGGVITGLTLNSGGTGYLNTPTLSFSGGGGSGATATATISQGAVTAINLTNGGSGYTSAPNVLFSGALLLTNSTTTAGSTAVTCASTVGLQVGASVHGVGIKGGATVASITDATHFVMSDPPNVAYAGITLNVGFTTYQLFNIQDDPYETTDLMLGANASSYAAIVSSLQSAISITPEVYPPYIGPALITNTAAQGSTVQLYVPFTSYAKNAPTLRWRKNGVNLTDGGNISGSTSFTTAVAPDGKVYVSNSYYAMLTLSNVTPADAGSYDVVINNVNTNVTPNVTNTVTSPAGTLSVVVGNPVLSALTAYTQGTSQTVSWSAITNATSYTVQAATDVNFASIVSSQTVSTTSATFNGLVSGTQYWFRASATDGVTTSAYSTAVTSTQDAVNPAVAITTPSDGATSSQTTVNVQGTASDALSGIAAVSVNGVAATTADNYAHWSAAVPLNVGGNTLIATATDAAGNTSTASITVSLSPVTPVISAVSTAPTSPTYMDPVYVVARVQPGQAAISQVKLSYNTATPVSTPIWREIFSNGNSNNWNGSGALNAWTTVGAGNVRQAVGTSNHTTPVALSAVATTSGSTTVTCASTAGLWPGMLITGTNIAGSTTGASTGNTTVASVTDASTFVLSQAATGTGTGLALTAAGVTLTNATTTAASTTVTCDSTAGLIIGMSLTGTGLANNTTVFSVTNSTTFVLSTNATASGTGLTLTASGTAAEFNGGTTSLTGSMFTTTGALNTTGTAGYVEFYAQTRDLAPPSTTVNVSGVVTSGSAVVTGSTTASLGVGMLLQGTGIAAGTSIVSIDSASQFTMSAVGTATATGAITAINNNQWTFQVSSDGGTNWNTRLSEDWSSKSLSLTNVVTNSAGSTSGSTTVTCASTSGLLAGRTLVGPNVYVTASTTSGSPTVTTASTATLAAGMFLTGTGIPNGTRILSIDSGTQFTMSANATATNASNALAATTFAANTTVSSVTNGTTFVLNTAAYVNTSASPITVNATSINHGFQLYHYDLTGTELGTQTKLRWQFAGYAPQTPTAKPRVDIDDILVATTAPPANIILTMLDDGLHGDGAANDGYYGVQIPVKSGGTTVNFTITATDTASGVTVNPAAGSYTYTVSSSITNATIKGAEFLGMPTDTSMTLNLIANVDQQVFIEYGTAPGSYTSATTPTLFSVDDAHPEFYNPIEITLTGLQPDTEYYYRVRYRTPGASFYNARGERSFHTARPRGRPFVFTITADPHLDVNTDQSLLARAIANVAADNPDFHIDLGDIFMTDKMEQPLVNGIPAIWGGELSTGQLNQSKLNDRAILLRNQFELACHSIPFFFTLGNHEAEYGYLFSTAADKQNNIPAWDLKSRKAYFPTPVPDTFYGGNLTPMNYTGGTLGLLEDYYAWEWGDALFIVLDPFWNTNTNPNQGNDAWNWSLGQTQYNWLRDTLKNSSARYKFVFMHHIVGGTTTLADGVTPNVAARGGVEVAGFYEWGGLNADGTTNGFAANRPGWGMPIHNLLVQNKVSAVFHGHDHLYGYQTLDGIVYLECPQPGTSNYTSLGSAADGKYTQGLSSLLLADSGHIRVTVTPTQVVADYVRAYRAQDENASRHNLDISNSFTLRPTVFPPIEIVAAGQGQVMLRWNAVPNKQYQIQWSTDLVTWQNVTTTPMSFTNTATNATYTDTLPARVNGQRAFYRVSYSP